MLQEQIIIFQVTATDSVADCIIIMTNYIEIDELDSTLYILFCFIPS